MSTWYISTTGNDSTGDGSIGSPYATVGKCITVGADGDTVKALNGTYTITSTTNVDKQVSIISNSGVAGDVIFDANCTIFNVQNSNVSITYMTLQSSSTDPLLTIDRMSTGVTVPTFWTGISISNCNLKYTGTALELNGTFTVNTNAFTRSSGTNVVDVIKVYSCRGSSSISSNTLTDSESITRFAYLTNTGSGTYLDRCNSKGGTLTISSNNITYTHASQSMTFIFQDYFNQYSYGSVGADSQYNINTKLSGTFSSNTITSDNVKCRFGLVSVSSNTDLDSIGNITINGNTLNNTDYGAWHLDKNTSSPSIVSLSSIVTRPMFKIYSNSLDSILTYEPNNIPNLQLWLDGKDNTTIKNVGDTNAVNDDPVATWQDKSGNARHVTQTTAGARPLYKTTGINNFPSLLFDGVDDRIFNAYSLNVQYFTIISVHKGGTNGTLWNMSSTQNATNYYPNFSGSIYLSNSEGNWHSALGLDNAKAWISVARYRQTPSNTTLLRVCSTADGITNRINEIAFTTNLVSNGFCIGAHVGEFFGALVGEIIVYNRPLTDVEISGLFTYLRNKWNI